uniref:Galectin n=1 Tax=Romanomermis culicivorax TaxID=13658 RepID=A0A915JTV1_ROMCU
FVINLATSSSIEDCKDLVLHVFLNGKSLGSFDYRQPIATISHVQILGDLVLNAVGWEGNYYKFKFLKCKFWFLWEKK